ncbi:MAG TPA: hypothetical protein EYN66_21995 [Myxococcales bacterium]|nr:hypothetical protein [Myxococcales bacterium]
MNHNRTLIFSIALATISACTPETEINATINGKEVEFESAVAVLQPIESGYRLTVNGLRKDNDFGLQVNVEFEASLIDEMEEESIFEIDGRAELMGEETTYIPEAKNSLKVSKVWIGAVCVDCDPELQLVQLLDGTLIFDDKDDEKAWGQLNLHSRGPLPGWTAEQMKSVDAKLEIIWAAPLEYDAGTTDAGTTDAGTTDAGTTDAGSTDGGTTDTGTTDSGTTDGGTTGGSPTESKTITLNAETGINFETGEYLKPGNFKNSDVYATAGKSYLKLTPGGPIPTQSNPVTWFKGAGGFHSTYSSLNQVPNSKPDDKGGKSLVKAKAGIGFVVQNNVSTGYTKGWIQNGGPNQVIIEYVLID